MCFTSGNINKKFIYCTHRTCLFNKGSSWWQKLLCLLMLGAHFTTYILWGHISWVIFCLWKAHGNILLYMWPKDFWSKILEANLGKGLLYSCVCFNALSCFEAFGIMMNRTTLGPDLTIKLDPDHSCMAMWFNLVGSPNLLENLRKLPQTLPFHKI